MKKLLSIVMALTFVLTAFSGVVFASNEETNAITAYVTVSRHGEFVKTKTGDIAVMLPVKLTEKPEYTLEDLFSELHSLYYDGEEGYTSATGDYGAYITKLWGDDSGNFGYQINGGTESVMGLTHPVENGDVVDAVVYRNLYPDTENYTKFEAYSAETLINKDFEITLSQAGYDENWNTVFSPCEGATITVNGEKTELLTDTDGKTVLSFDNEGIYVVSACKEKTINENTENEKIVPAITAPVCVVTAEKAETVLVRNIADKYCGEKIATDENMVWLIADMAVYNSLYPELGKALPDSVKQTCLDKIIKTVDETSKASVLAKNIIALRALGYDAKNVVNENSAKIDVAEKLAKLIDSGDEEVINIYTLPYVMIALSQGENYATDEQKKKLFDAAVASKEKWQDDEWGTDAAAAMLLALAPYYDYETYSDVAAIIDETVKIILSTQSETGSIGNAASTGLAMVALSALGKDCEEAVCGENSIIDGLVSQAAESLDGFEPMENTYSTEQGFRGLLAWKLSETGDRMYDFSTYPANEAVATKKQTSGGFFSGGGGGGSKPSKKDEVKEDTEVAEEVKETEEIKEKPVEETAEKEPEILENKDPDVKILPVAYENKTFEDISSHENKNEIEALAKRGIINGKTEKSYDPDGKMTRAEFATIVVRGLGLESGEKTAFSDVKETDWFCEYINTAYNYGIIKGVSETEFNPGGVITRQEAAVMVMRASKLCGMNTEANETAVRDTIAVFSDYMQIKDWAKDAVAFCCENGIVDGDGIEILPLQNVSRAEVAEMVFAMLTKSGLLQEIDQ